MNLREFLLPFALLTGVAGASGQNPLESFSQCPKAGNPLSRC